MSQDPLSLSALQQAIAELGFELVDAEIAGRADRRVIRLRIDLPGGSQPGAGVTTEDCQRVSRALEADWEARGVVGPNYALEVSSPGIERPVRFVEHWRRYIGHQVRFKATGLSGTRTGRIVGVPDDQQVELEMGTTRQVIALADIKRATLVVDWSAIGGTGKQENH